MERIVLPGEFLGTEEEYIAGPGTRVENGRIYSIHCGSVEVTRDKQVVVHPKVQAPGVLREGMTVYGRVEEIFEPIALVRVEPTEAEEVRQSPSESYCVLHAMRIAPRYVENVRDEVRIGDVIKAIVEKLERGEVLLSTKAPGLGVVKAFCSRCRAPLPLRKAEPSVLKCERCGSTERRRVSDEYSYVK